MSLFASIAMTVAAVEGVSGPMPPEPMPIAHYAAASAMLPQADSRVIQVRNNIPAVQHFRWPNNYNPSLYQHECQESFNLKEWHFFQLMDGPLTLITNMRPHAFYRGRAYLK